MAKHGPIETPDNWIPGDDSVNPTDCTYDGLSGEFYGKHKGSGGKIKEVTFVEEGAFGRIPSED